MTTSGKASEAIGPPRSTWVVSAYQEIGLRFGARANYHRA